MMKQPAENTNATAEEIRKAEERKLPIEQNGPEDRERKEELTRQLAAERGEPEEVARRRAEEVLRNRKNAQAKP